MTSLGGWISPGRGTARQPRRDDEQPDPGEPAQQPQSGLVGPRWVVHVPVEATDEADALRLAREVATLLAESQAAVDAGSVEISREDSQGTRTRVFCNAIGEGGRCNLEPGHHPGAPAAPNQPRMSPTRCPWREPPGGAESVRGAGFWGGSGSYATVEGLTQWLRTHLPPRGRAAQD